MSDITFSRLVAIAKNLGCGDDALAAHEASCDTNAVFCLIEGLAESAGRDVRIVNNLRKVEEAHRESANAQFHRANRIERERDQAEALAADLADAISGLKNAEDAVARYEKHMLMRRVTERRIGNVTEDDRARNVIL